MANSAKKTEPYSKALQQTLGGTPGQPGWLGQGLGFSQDDIAALQQAGISVSDLQGMQLVGGPTTTSPGYGGSGGQAGIQQSNTAYTPQQQQNAALLRAMLKIGGGQQQQAQPQPPTWNQVGQAAGLSQADINQFQTMGKTPADIATQFNVQAALAPAQTGLASQPVTQPVKQFQRGGLVTSQDQQPTDAQLFSNALYQPWGLGAAALQTQMVAPSPPGGTPSAQSGVAPVGKPIVSQTVPSAGGGWNWNSLGNAFGLGQSDIAGYQAKGLSPQQAADQLNSTWNPATATAIGQAAGLSRSDLNAFQASGLTPQQVANRFGVQAGVPTPSATPGLQGPWSTTPGVFVQAARTAPTQVTPLQPAVQPTATTYNPTATPFAQAPPAPGVTPPAIPAISPTLLAAHTSGLADAGKAIFAHFGGDPNSASPADIENFHRQLTDTVGAAMPSPSPMANPLASGPPQPIPWQQAWAGQHGLTNPTPPAGGPTPQPWVTSTRPPPPGAPASPAAGIAAIGPPKQMQGGGLVPGRGNRDMVPALLTPGEYVIPKDQVPGYLKMADGGTVPDPNAPPEARRQRLTTAAAQSSQTAPPAAPGGGPSSSYSSLTSGLATAAQTYANSMSNLPRNPIGSGSGVDIRNTRLDPDPDLPSLKAAGMLGGGGMSQGMQSGLSGIGSALTQASKDIAASTPPWRMQQNAIPAPLPAPAAPQFTQPQVAQQAQQGLNPYAAYAANQAMYPTSPYYR